MSGPFPTLLGASDVAGLDMATVRATLSSLEAWLACQKNPDLPVFYQQLMLSWLAHERASRCYLHYQPRNSSDPRLRVVPPPPLKLSLTYESLKCPRLGLLEGLYGSRWKCVQCARRFKTELEKTAHVQDHFLEHHKRERAASSSRMLFLTVGDWVEALDESTSMPSVAVSDTEEKTVEAELRVELQDTETVSSCPECGDDLSVVWDHGQDTWMCLGAARAINGRVYHTECLPAKTRHRKASDADRQPKRVRM